MATQFLVGDVREMLRTLPDESVHCVVTSPPYWGLRDYGTARWIGGDPDCDHLPEPPRCDGPKQTGQRPSGHASKAERIGEPICRKCGAIREDVQLGLEPTPEAYVAAMVEVFREVRRVLRKDGTCWLNLGDTYAGSRCGPNGDDETGRHVVESDDFIRSKRQGKRWGGGDVSVPALPAKNLVGTPWRVAFALQEDGWWLRSDIVWAKPNPMPESVTDRPTRSHEYLFLLAKSERYFYDAEAIKEPGAAKNEHDATGQGYIAPGQTPQAGNRQKVPSGWDTSEGAHGTIHRDGRSTPDKQRGHSRRHAGFNDRWDAMNKEQQGSFGRNKRDVWIIATQPFPEAHFATFPDKLVEPCILAGCPEGGTVLDPFGGSGTVASVAKRLGRSSIYIDANPKYAEMAQRRVAQTAAPPIPLFQDEAGST